MPYEHLNRAERRQMAAVAKQEALKRPIALTEIPQARWPPVRLGHTRPIKIWESQNYLVQLFEEKPFKDVELNRLSVCRTTLQTDGRWEANLSWDELMDIKREVGFGDWYALEIYPRDLDIVNVANMRHMWLLATPLDIGWFVP